MGYRILRLDIASGVARLELHRPDAANAIDMELAVEFEQAVAALVGDDHVRAVLHTGAGARFCGGGDVAPFANNDTDALPISCRRSPPISIPQYSSSWSSTRR